MRGKPIIAKDPITMDIYVIGKGILNFPYVLNLVHPLENELENLHLGITML